MSVWKDAAQAANERAIKHRQNFHRLNSAGFGPESLQELRIAAFFDKACLFFRLKHKGVELPK